MERADGHWGYRSSPRSLTGCLAAAASGCPGVADWAGPLLQPLEMGAPGALAGPCPLYIIYIIYMPCPVSSTLDCSYMQPCMLLHVLTHVASYRYMYMYVYWWSDRVTRRPSSHPIRLPFALPVFQNPGTQSADRTCRLH